VHAYSEQSPVLDRVAFRPLAQQKFTNQSMIAFIELAVFTHRRLWCVYHITPRYHATTNSAPAFIDPCDEKRYFLTPLLAAPCPQN